MNQDNHETIAPTFGVEMELRETDIPEMSSSPEPISPDVLVRDLVDLPSRSMCTGGRICFVSVSIILIICWTLVGMSIYGLVGYEQCSKTVCDYDDAKLWCCSTPFASSCKIRDNLPKQQTCDDIHEVGNSCILDNWECRLTEGNATKIVGHSKHEVYMLPGGRDTKLMCYFGISFLGSIGLIFTVAICCTRGLHF